MARSERKSWNVRNPKPKSGLIYLILLDWECVSQILFDFWFLIDVQNFAELEKEQNLEHEMIKILFLLF